MTQSHAPRKRFGQNFLHDTQVIKRLIDFINPQMEDRLVEIGPGRGALTQEILPHCKRLVAIELDRDLIAPLRVLGLLSENELELFQADILKFDLKKLWAADPSKKLRIVGNLPYNISTPILFYLATSSAFIQDMFFMLQKEVVDRMIAGPGSRTYGRLSVMCQFYWTMIPLLTISPEAFFPAPKVDSAFVRLVPHPQAPVDPGDPGALAEVVRAAFGQRRKTLRNALNPLLTSEQIIAAGINPMERAEQVDLEGFAALSRQLTPIWLKNKG